MYLVNCHRNSNGNLTSDGSVNFTYDTENRLISASGVKTATLKYDPLGRLFEVAAPSGTTRFLYDGDALVGEYNIAGTMLHRYAHGNGVDQPLVWYDGGTVNSSNRRHLFANWQGSIAAITNASGSAIGVNAYDAYGIPNDTNVGRFQYTGQILIPEIGIYHYKARAYSPYMGRFLQTDPIGYNDQYNLYAYVGNDPVGNVDPTGMYKCESKESCDAAEKGRKQMVSAEKYYRREARAAGKDIKRAGRLRDAANGISKNLKSLGTKNDGEGPTIVEGTPINGAKGQFDPRNDTITISSSRIADAGGRVGETLAHELQHYRQKGQKLSPLAEEVRPFLIQFIVGRAPGGTIAGGISAENYVRRRLFPAYCSLPASYCNPAIKKVYQQEKVKPF